MLASMSPRGPRRCSVVLVLLAACSRSATSTPAAPAAASPPPAAPTASAWRPDVVVVTLDTTRADALGCYGGPEWATPTLDALAARGVRFQEARTVAPLTLPAHSTIFTGVTPFQHGVRDNGTFVLSPTAHTLAERLKEAGYRTAAVPAAFVVDSSFGLAQGFDDYFDLRQRDVVAGDVEGTSRNATEVTELALGWLAKAPRTAPFLLWVHYFDAHFPYQPPADLLEKHPPPDDPKQKGGAKRNARHLYELEVANVDRELARLLAALERRSGAGETLVVVVGDHGEGLGEHSEASHGALVHDATLRVPLLLAQRRFAPQVVDAPVSSVDVTPTLLALLGLPADGTTGADLAPLFDGSKRPFTPTRDVYFETCGTWFTSGWGPLYGLLLDGRWKFVAGRTARLFDLANDRGEEHDVAGDHDDLVERGKERLAELAQQTIAASRHDLSSDEARKLAAMGYVQREGGSRRDDLAPPGWQPKEALTPEQGLERTRRFAQANLLWQQGRRDEGMKLLLDLVHDEPENAHYAEIAAALLFESHRAADALPLARKAVDLAPNVGNRSTLLVCLIALGHTDEAIAVAKGTVEQWPRTLPARVHLARLLLAKSEATTSSPQEAEAAKQSRAQAVEQLEFVLEATKDDAAMAQLRAEATKLLESARKR
jgi:arylsulfatase A-like enzyme